MANNRIYIRCKGCGETLYLGKHFAANYYWRNYAKANYDLGCRDEYTLANKDRHLEDDLNEFFLEHDFHCNCFNAFEIAYEVPDDEDNQKEDGDYWVYKEGGVFPEEMNDDD